MLVLAIIIAAWTGWKLLPGAGGVSAELRWLLARDYVPPQHWNRALGLLRFAEQREPGRKAELYRSLLFDEDERVVYAGVRLLATDFETPGMSLAGLQAVFQEWFGQASVSEKVTHLPDVLHCILQAFGGRPGGADSYVLYIPGFEDWDLPLTEEDQRWMVAGMSLDILNEPDGETLWRVVLRPPAEEIIYRLCFLDGVLGGQSRQRFADGVHTPLTLDELRDELQLSVDRVVGMLDDPIDEVRWGAGRILAVAGDPRGLPAFTEWLRQHPARRKAADQLMTPLFGPDWRQLGESGGATSQPGAGDGGG